MLSFDQVAILCAGFVAGAVNSVAGGGTLLTFPVLIWAGRDPIIANATNALALWPGSVAGSYAFRREALQMRPLLEILVPVSIVGSLVGGVLLLATPSRMFSSLVPWLVLAATLLLAMQKPLMRMLGTQSALEAVPKSTRWLAVGQFFVAVYGGYFGAGQGILMLASLALFGLHDIHLRNGVKNVLAVMTNGAAGIYFACVGAVVWSDALLLAGSSMLGGYAAASWSRGLPKAYVERFVLAVGISATIALAWRR